MKSIVNAYYEYLKNDIINNALIGPMEKSAAIEKLILIRGLYDDNYISGRECMILFATKLFS